MPVVVVRQPGLFKQEAHKVGRMPAHPATPVIHVAAASCYAVSPLMQVATVLVASGACSAEQGCTGCKLNELKLSLNGVRHLMRGVDKLATQGAVHAVANDAKIRARYAALIRLRPCTTLRSLPRRCLPATPRPVLHGVGPQTEASCPQMSLLCKVAKTLEEAGTRKTLMQSAFS